jgi:hypothetical protein
MAEETNKQRLIRLLNNVDNLMLRVNALSGVVQGATDALNRLIVANQETNKILEGVQEALAEIQAAESLAPPASTAATPQQAPQASSPASPPPLPRSRPRG